jgi:hypothetical protein
MPVIRPSRPRRAPPTWKIEWHDDDDGDVEIVTPPPEPVMAIVSGITTPPRPTIQWNPKYSGSSDVDPSLDDPWKQPKNDFGSMF